MNKKLLIGILAVSLLAGCSSDNASFTATETPQSFEQSRSIELDAVIKGFEKEGLELGEISTLTDSEFGDVKEKGLRILIPSLGDDIGGRLYKFHDPAGLKTAKDFYADINDLGPTRYVHTHSSGDLLLQMSGDMPKEDFEAYAAVLDELTGN